MMASISWDRGSLTVNSNHLEDRSSGPPGGGSWKRAMRAAEIKSRRSTSQPRAEQVLDVEHPHGNPASVHDGKLIEPLAQDPEGVGDELIRADHGGRLRHSGGDPLLLALGIAGQEPPEVPVREDSREPPVRPDDADP